MSGVAPEFDEALKISLNTREPSGYAVGSWTGDIHHELLWHRVIGQKSGRLSGFPTWSWASYNGPIDWVIGSYDRIRDRCEVEKVVPARVPDLSPLTVEDGGLAIGQAQQATAQNKTSLAGNFAAIWIRGLLQPVRISSRFQDQEEIKVVTRATACGNRVVHDAGWRTVAVAQAPGIIAGWASLEDPALQDDSAFVRAPLIFALLVSTTAGIINARFGLGNVYSHQVFIVLYLKRSGVVTNSYEIAGVGRLVGREVEDGFNRAHEKSFVLI